MFKQLENSQFVQNAKKINGGWSIWPESIKMLLLTLISTIINALLASPILMLLTVYRVCNEGNIAIVTLLLTGIINIIIFIWLSKKIQKRELSTLGFSAHGMLIKYASGFGFGIFLSIFIILMLNITGNIKIVGFSSSFNILKIIFLFLAISIQMFAEELICRGYVMTSIMRKNSALSAIIASSIISSFIYVGNAGFNIIAIINCFLFGVLFSIFTIQENNIWYSSGIKTIWSFSLITLNGTQSTIDSGLPVILEVTQHGNTILNGGGYGANGSIITTFVLAIILFSLYWKHKQNFGDRYGRQLN